MSKLFSYFSQSKNKRDLSPQETAKRKRRQPKKNNDLVYIDTGNRHRFDDNVNCVYRTEINSQIPQNEIFHGPNANGQNVSPERGSLSQVYSFEQRPSFKVAADRKNSKEPKNLKAYAANVVCVPVTSDRSLPYGIPMENVPRRSTVTQPDTTSLQIENHEYIQGSERQSTLGMLKVDNENCSPRRSSRGNENVTYSVLDNIATETNNQTTLRARPRSSKNFALGNSVNPMVFRAEDVKRSSMSGGKPLIKTNKQLPLLTTEDGKVLRPLTSETARRLSTAKSRASQQIKFSVVRPPEGGEDFPLAHGAERASQQIKLSVVRPPEAVEDFPLAHGAEMMVAAPMIGGGGAGGMKKPQKTTSILRNPPRGGGNARPRGGPQTFDDYDDYPYEDEYGRGNYRQPYYDDDPDMYSYGYGAPTYYDDGYGYQDEYYGRGPPPGMARGGGRPPRQHAAIYAAQIPGTTLPAASFNKRKNTSEPSDTPETLIQKQNCDLKGDLENTSDLLTNGSPVKLISTAQQTDQREYQREHQREPDFIYFSPERFFTATEVSRDPNTKLKWRILVKRGDKE